MFVGILLVLLGGLMLLEKMDVISGSIWDYFLPIALVALGASMIFSRRRRRPVP
ncbi:MAG: DUF5668 domain-containing protein [Candidatus Zixiibacteriota bacterium]